MNFLILALSFSTSAFSMEPEAFKNGLEKIYSAQAEKIQLCNNQNEKLIKTAYKLYEKPVNPNESVAFIEDEKKALEIIQAIDLNKIFSPSELEGNKFLVKNCNKKNSLIFDEVNAGRAVCLNTSDEMHFMESLIFATKNYHWSAETKAKAKKLVLDYIHTSTQTSNQPLIRNMISGSLIKLMADYNLIPAEYSDEAKKIIQDADKSQEKLVLQNRAKSKNSKLAAKAVCDNLKNYKNEQIKLSNDVEKKIQELLKRIN